MSRSALISACDIDLPNCEASEHFAMQLVPYLAAPMLLTLSGDIGAGKTTMVRAMLRAMGVTGRIKSPTFSLLETYDLGMMQWHHFDLYRLNGLSELDDIGFRDYFQPQAIVCIEWPERLNVSDIEVDLALSLTSVGHGRSLRLRARQDLIEGIRQQMNGL